MATYTPNYNLIKPDYEEPADVAQLNNNADLIDAALSGKVNKSGDTMTGILTVPTQSAVKGTETYTQIDYQDNNGDRIGSLVINNSTRRAYWLVECTDTNYHENFVLPAPDTGRTANKDWDILTSKTPVTIAQGGTGSTGVITYTSANDIFASVGTGITISIISAAVWGKLVQLRIGFTYANDITVPTHGNISNTTIGTLKSEFKPAASAVFGGDGDTSYGPKFGIYKSNNFLSIVAADSHETEYTIPANTTLGGSIFYLLA